MKKFFIFAFAFALLFGAMPLSDVYADDNYGAITVPMIREHYSVSISEDYDAYPVVAFTLSSKPNYVMFMLLSAPDTSNEVYYKTSESSGVTTYKIGFHTSWSSGKLLGIYDRQDGTFYNDINISGSADGYITVGTKDSSGVFTPSGTFDILYAGCPLTYPSDIDTDVMSQVDFNDNPEFISSITGMHIHSWSDAWSNDETYHWHECLNADGACDVVANTDKDSYSAHVYDNESDDTCNTCNYVRELPHVHSWSDTWANDETYHWHECLNADGKCDIVADTDKDSYSSHVYDDDSDSTCNTCNYERTIVPDVTPEPSVHVHEWSDAYTYTKEYHSFYCENNDGLCDITDVTQRLGYGLHVYDDEEDTICNVCSYDKTWYPDGDGDDIADNADFLDMIPVILSLFLVFPLNVFLSLALIVLCIMLYRKLKRK